MRPSFEKAGEAAAHALRKALSGGAGPEERQSLLAREVDHRARNALAVVQAIIRLTRAKTVDAYVEAVEGRIRALSRAHMLLSHARWQGADLGRLVEHQRVVSDGVDVGLDQAREEAERLA